MYTYRTVYALVEERFENDNLVPRLNEAHESTQYALICPSRNGDLGIGVDLPSKERRICICNSFSQSRASLFNHQPQINQYLPSGQTFVGEYWLHSTLSSASFAASKTNLGGL